MKYFRINAESTYWCGFSTQKVIKLEKEDDYWDTNHFYNFEDEMVDYISGHLDEEDFEEYEDADSVFMALEEITKEEYEEEIEWEQ